MEAMRVAIISSPALAAVQNVQSEEWVREWVLAVCQEDGPGEAKKYAEAVVGMGVRSKRRLAQLDMDDLLAASVPRVAAKALVAQAAAQVAPPASAAALSFGGGAGTTPPAVAWSAKDIEDFPKGVRSNFAGGEYSLPEAAKVMTHLSRVVSYAESRGPGVAKALDTLMSSPGMTDSEFEALELSLSVEDQGNLKAMLVGTMEDSTVAYLEVKVGRRHRAITDQLSRRMTGLIAREVISENREDRCKIIIYS